MNALEMAEAMEGRARVRRKITNRENTGDRLSDQLEQAATMLRQQQALIKQLEETQDYLYKTHDADKAEIDSLRKNLDVALMIVNKPKLTDEEILQVHSQMMENSKGQLPPYVDFARALLRKAQT